MNSLKQHVTLFILFSFLFSCVTHTRYHSQEQNPMDNINYVDAFNQTEIHDKYKPLLTAWNCDKNVFKSDEFTKNHETEMDEETLQKMEKDFQSACLKKLYAARHWTLVEPALEDLTFIALMTAGTVIISKMIKKDSLGGSFAVNNSVFSSVFFLKDFIKLGYHLIFPEQSSLTNLEEQFALNQSFIPRDLWPAIIEKFMIARQNKFEQGKAMNFLEFSLGLTVYKPRPKPDLQEKSIEQIIEILHKKIDSFFDDYDKKGLEKSLQLIKVNVSKFILRLLKQNDSMPRYIYFHGPAGIGKTFFVNELCNWIEELVPGSVRFDNMVITDAVELEGNPQRPGALLRILRNQSIANKRGSVVFMDEATWLNQMQSAAKRTFNDDQSEMTTDYFGDGIEGAGISIAIPPMLFFLASNDEIKDPALKSRFDIVQFPNPTESALAKHAMKKTKESAILSGSEIPKKSKIQAWLQDEKINNFRQVEANVEQFVLSDTD